MAMKREGKKGKIEKRFSIDHVSRTRREWEKCGRASARGLRHKPQGSYFKKKEFDLNNEKKGLLES